METMYVWKYKDGITTQLEHFWQYVYFIHFKGEKSEYVLIGYSDQDSCLTQPKKAMLFANKINMQSARERWNELLSEQNYSLISVKPF